MFCGWRVCSVVILIILFSITIGCAGKGGAAPSKTVVDVKPTITVTPPTATMVGGSTIALVANISNAASTDLKWTATGGTVTGTGTTITYKAPTVAGTYTVTATITSANVSASSTITVTAPPPPTNKVVVTVSPATATIAATTAITLIASVTGTNNQAVTWIATAGTITGTGLTVSFTAPATAGTVTVTAKSADPSGATGTATITVTATPIKTDVAISLLPSNSNMLGGDSQPFAATVTGATDTSVTFTVTGGTLTGTGSTQIYTAPLIGGTYTVTAIANADPTRKAFAVITVLTLALQVNPPIQDVLIGTTFSLTAVALNTTVTTVTWSATGGTISGTGTTISYTAPNTPGAYTVTATADADSRQKARVTVNVRGKDLYVYEVDGITQANRPITFGRVFAKGEIAQCPQPVIGGSAVTPYQADVKNRWDDGSVKFAIISFTQTLTPQSSTTVTFQNNSSCNNAGFLTQPQMTGFNSGNWGGQIVVTPAGGGTAATADAKAMLAASDPGANTFGDCKNNYWMQGPVVTAVIVQDCTAASAFDFGWFWDGTTMGSSGRAGDPYTGNSPYASFHPMFILYFYPSINAVQVEAIWELPWTYSRLQDQLADVVVKTGSPLTVQWPVGWSGVRARKLTDISTIAQSSTMTSAGAANFTSADQGASIVIDPTNHISSHIIKAVNSGSNSTLSDAPSFSLSNVTGYLNLQVHQSRHRKTFWSGSAPGHVRIGHNFAYLKSTRALPNYDSGVSAGPDQDYTQFGASTCCQWSYNIWATTTDRGEVGGTDGLPQDYGANDEGAPLQREELLYLYNMDATSCGQPNSACAKAWQMLTGESGALDGNLTANNVVGGGGQWSNLGNVGFHVRESHTNATGLQSASTNFFYCSNFADKNTGGGGVNPVTTASSCGTGSGDAFGKPHSRHAHSDVQLNTVVPVGIPGVAAYAVGPGGWSGFPLCDHWLDYAYTPYLLTGDYFNLEELYFSASQCVSGHNYDQTVSGGIFGYPNSTETLREFAWSLQVTGRAAFIAPDSTPEQSYYKSMVDSWLEVTEGILGATGTSLTPSSTNANCTNYDYRSANRWDWGRCTVISRCINTGSTCSAGNGQTSVVPSMHEIETTNPYVNAATCPQGIQPYYASTLSNVASGEEEDWFYWYFTVAVSELEEMPGFSEAHTVADHMRQRLEEHVLSTTYNPYLIAASASGQKNASNATSCANNGPSFANTDQFFTTYTQKLNGFSTTAQYGGFPVTNMRTISSFDAAPPFFAYACGDHGYSLIARAAGSFLQEFGTTSAEASCPSGGCAATAAWKWIDTEVPYFNLQPLHSTSCPKYQNEANPTEQIKYALAPR